MTTLADPRHLPLIRDALTPTQTTHGASRWAELRRCPRAHHLRYTLGIQRIHRIDDGVDYFALGTLIHGALAYWQRNALSWQDVIEHALDEAAGGSGLREALDAHRLLEGYEAHWGSNPGGWPNGATVVAVEHAMGLPPYTARADSIIDLGGELIVVDHKTRARKLPDQGADLDEYRRELATRPQFLGLSWLAQREWSLPDPPPVMVNAIVKTKIPQYGRVLVRFDQRQIDEWAANQDQAAERAMRNDDPLPNYESCAPEIGSRCWAFNWCHGSAEQRDREYTRELRDPE